MAKEKEGALTLETLAGGVPDLSKPATAARFAEIISAGTLDKLTPQQQSVFLAGLGAYIGIKPELGDLMIYDGKPYITISGYRRIAHNTGLLNGLSAEPASDRDFARYKATPGEYLWICYVHKKGCVRPFIGWGFVRLNEVKGTPWPNGRKPNPVCKTHPQEIARKRAVYDGLRLAFPPSEVIGAIHTHYIDEAEAAATRGHVAGRLAENDYTDEAIDREVEAEGAVATESADFIDDRDIA